jgi:glycosyltransferase involved in cell wall biosynthesis
MTPTATLAKRSATSETDGPVKAAPAVRPWSVMHATEHVRDVMELAEAQRGIGMRPVLVTPAGYGSIELYLREPAPDERDVSLLGTWQEVRQWRKSLGDCATAGAMDIVHAHCFSAGMSGVRNWPVVVYDLKKFVEQDAEADQQWLARSLRVAEQFVLARAEAVVLHWASQREKALERGATAEHLFVVPEPLVDKAAESDREWRQGLRLAEDAVAFYAANVKVQELDALLSAFAQVVSEVEETVLLLEAADAASAALRNKLAAAGITRAVRLISAEQRESALRGADVVLTGTPPAGTPNHEGMTAMRSGRAVLAADVPANRDISPEGRGCLWYKPSDARDLAGRASFLARNSDFRKSLGAGARSYVEETRSPEAVARQYDAVYRHAYARRGDDTQQFLRRFQPLQAAF